MRVAVLGAGNGGVASAFDFAQHGHEVALYAPPEYGENVVAVHEVVGVGRAAEHAPQPEHPRVDDLGGVQGVVAVLPCVGVEAPVDEADREPTAARRGDQHGGLDAVDRLAGGDGPLFARSLRA